jgi:hypothetical protein
MHATRRLVCLAALLVLQAPTARAAGWGPEQTVALPTNARVGDLAMNGAGDAAVSIFADAPAETSTDGVSLLVIRRIAGGLFGAPESIDTANDSPMGAMGLDVAPDGTLLAASELKGNQTGVLLRTAPPGGQVSPPLAVAPTDTYPMHSPQVAGGADGTTIVAWDSSKQYWDGDARLRWALRSPSGALGPIGTTSATLRSQPVLAADEAGDAVLAWVEDAGPAPVDGPRSYLLRVMRRTAGGEFGPPETMADPGPGNIFEVHLAVATGGRVALSWSEVTGEHTPRQEIVKARTGTVADGLGPAQDLTPVISADVTNGDISVNGHGDVVAAWTVAPPPGWQGAPPGPSHAQARLAPAGAWRPTVDLPGDSYNNMETAIAPDGTAMVTWATENTDHAAAAVAPPGGTFGTPTAYASVDSALHVAFDAAGRGLVLWRSEWSTLNARAYTAGSAPPGSEDVAQTPAPPTQAPPPSGAPASGVPLTGGQTPPPPAHTVDGAPIAGTAATRCRVPVLRGLSYQRAKARLTRAACRIGNAKRPRGRKTTKNLVVGSQSHKAGTITKAGAKVDVVLRVKKQPKRTAGHH